jgi:hypothetical protein
MTGAANLKSHLSSLFQQLYLVKLAQFASCKLNKDSAAILCCNTNYRKGLTL